MKRKSAGQDSLEAEKKTKSSGRLSQMKKDEPNSKRLRLKGNPSLNKTMLPDS